MTHAQRASLADFGAQLMASSTGIEQDHEGMRRTIAAVILQTEIEVRCCRLDDEAKEQREIAERFHAEAASIHSATEAGA